MKLLSTKDGAALLGRSRWTVLRALQRGQLPGVKVGRSWLLDADELARQIAERRGDGGER